MHVSHHFRPLPIPVSASAEARAARQKPDTDPDKVAPVERRFSEDEAQEQRRRQQSRRDKSFETDETQPFEDRSSPRSAAASPVQAAASQPASPLDSLLAGMRGDMSTSSSNASRENHEPSVKPSLDDLLALMRAAPEKP